MTISIQKVYNKGSGRLNEDDFLIKDRLFAVFDGASSLVKFVNKKRETGGKLAAKIAKKVFSKNNKSLKQLAIDVNNQILLCMKREYIDIDQKETLWSTSAAVIRLKNKEAEFFQIGDCLILTIFKDDSYKLITKYKDPDLRTMKKWKELPNRLKISGWEGIKNKGGFSHIFDDIIKVRREVNIKYGCLNGEKGAVKFFDMGKFTLNNIKSIVIFTDGLFIPKENPEEPENWYLFVKIYQESGLKGILRYVRSLEKTDPNCWRYPRFKQHDDIAAIGINFL